MGAASKPFGLLLACMSIVVGLLASGAAVARTPNGVSFPPSMTVNGTTLTLNGTGTRTVSYFVDAYASALYLRSPAHTLRAVLAERDPKVLVTRYLRDATVPQTIAEYKSMHDKFCSANPCSPPSAASFQRVLDAVTPNSVGDSSTDVVDNGTLTISRNGKIVLTLRDPTYARDFIATVAGPSSPTDEYRDGLLDNQ